LVNVGGLPPRALTQTRSEAPKEERPSWDKQIQRMKEDLRKEKALATDAPAGNGLIESFNHLCLDVCLLFGGEPSLPFGPHRAKLQSSL
jgi:hypothetical protein